MYTKKVMVRPKPSFMNTLFGMGSAVMKTAIVPDYQPFQAGDQLPTGIMYKTAIPTVNLTPGIQYMSPPIMSPPIMAPQPVKTAPPDMVTASADPSSSPGIPNIVLWGGAAVLAYVLFMRK